LHPASRRLLVCAAAILVLGALLYWQWRRDRLVSDCNSAGGTWDGPASTCRLPAGRILIRPDLQRG
jgi:hypothetical protein